MLRKLRRIASPRKFLIYVILFSFGILLYFYHDLQPSDHKIHSMDVLSPYECSHNYKVCLLNSALARKISIKLFLL